MLSQAAQVATEVAKDGVSLWIPSAVIGLFIAQGAQVAVALINRKTKKKPGESDTCLEHTKAITILNTHQLNTVKSLERIETKLDNVLLQRNE
jgi:hypothetical protein